MLPGGVETHSKTPPKSDIESGAQAYTFLWKRIRKSYQAIYFAMTKDLETIPGSILTYSRGF